MTNAILTRLLVIDDDIELAAMLRAYLEAEGLPTHVVHDGATGLAEALSGRYALAIIDVMLPDASGLDLLGRIRERSRMPVLMLTARGDDADRVTGLELGADDYVPKPCTAREVLARVRAILRRARPGAEAHKPLSAGGLFLWPAERRAEFAGLPLPLTNTEFDLVAVLIRHAGTPVSKQQLSERGLGRPLAPFDRSVEVHLSSIRRKLAALPGGRDRIKTVFRRGYQLVTP